MSGFDFEDLLRSYSKDSGSQARITNLQLEVVKHVNEKKDLLDRLNAEMVKTKTLTERLNKSQAQVVQLTNEVQFKDGIIQSQTIMIEQFTVRK